MENKENPNLDKNDINQDTSQASEKQLDDENLEAKKDTEEQKEEKTPEEKILELEDKITRTFAEMENQRRRYEKEKFEAFEFGGFNFARESLLLLDNIDRAIISFKNDENLKDNKDLNKFLDGIEIVKKDLVSIFKKNGIEVIECIDKKFDPNFHQAMLEVENNAKEPGTVVQEIQKGYMMKDRLLRPSFVGVTKKIEEKVKKTPDNDKNTEK